MKVDEVKLGATDSAGAQIEAVFARRVPGYAVYRTKDRVLVHYADAQKLEAQQRSDLVGIGPLRGEINGLIDSWRNSRLEGARSKAARYERRVADALTMALEGDPDGAKALLETIKLDIHEERVSRARFQYLLVASATLAAAVLAIALMTAYAGLAAKLEPLWLAAGAGAFGAFFSIAIGIRNRTVLPDMRIGDNSADAILRILIGLLAAAVLIFLLQSGVVATPTFGNRTVEIGLDPPARYSWTMVVVVGFVAGFLERLVPDLLADSAIARVKPAAPKAPVGTTAPKTEAKAAAGDTAQAKGPAGAEGPAGEDVDNCFDRNQADDLTPDEDLPPARGGVATL